MWLLNFINLLEKKPCPAIYLYLYPVIFSCFQFLVHSTSDIYQALIPIFVIWRKIIFPKILVIIIFYDIHPAFPLWEVSDSVKDHWSQERVFLPLAFHKSWIAQSLRLYCEEKLEGIDTVSDLRVFQLESLVMFEASKIKNSLT